MKKSKAVLEAEAAVMAKAEELEEAKKAVLRIGKELSAARLDVIAAQTTADSEADIAAAFEAGRLAERNRCRYPECTENEDERCPRWLTGECEGPNA